jgi:hypothetical protein
MPGTPPPGPAQLGAPSLAPGSECGGPSLVALLSGPPPLCMSHLVWSLHISVSVGPLGGVESDSSSHPHMAQGWAPLGPGAEGGH